MHQNYLLTVRLGRASRNDANARAYSIPVWNTVVQDYNTLLHVHTGLGVGKFLTLERYLGSHGNSSRINEIFT